MNNFELMISTKLVFGVGTIDKLSEIAMQYGKKALLVTTGKDLDKVGILGKVISLLAKAEVEAVLYDGVSPNPRTHNVNDGVKVFKDNHCDFVIGLGGGSAMDCAKSIALVAKNGGSINDYVLDGKYANAEIQSKYPCICIATTAGTGSEMTNFSVLIVPETHEKPGFGFPCLAPELSIVDPMLMVTMPKGVTASTGIDVFFHAMEAYLSRAATPFSDMCALTAMKITADNLGKVLSDGNDIEARCQMAWASTLGGLSIFQTDGAIGIHAIGQVLSGLTDVEHGKSLCTIAPAYLKYTWEGDIQRYADVSRILGADPRLSDEKAAESAGDLLWDLLVKYNLNCTLSGIGLGTGEVDKIVDDAYRASGAAFDKTLKELTVQDVRDIVEASLQY